MACLSAASDERSKSRSKWTRVGAIVASCAGGGVGLYFFIKWLVDSA